MYDITYQEMEAYNLHFEAVEKRLILRLKLIIASLQFCTVYKVEYKLRQGSIKLNTEEEI